jgi:quercetin dioxygenase-like cupin family protein
MSPPLMHIGRRGSQQARARYEGYARGHGYVPLVDDASGSVHLGQGVSVLAGDGVVQQHMHSYEEAFYLLEGRVQLWTAAGTKELGPGDFGFFAVGEAHAWRNAASAPVRWLEAAAPQPVGDGRVDTVFLQDVWDSGRELPAALAGDPRGARTGHWRSADLQADYGPDWPPPGMDAKVLRAAPGIYVKELVGQALGADHLTLLMVEFAAGTGMGGTMHDHPYEESFFLLDGVIDGACGPDRYQLMAGDTFWVSVSAPHGWQNNGETAVRWLEVQAPQPPTRRAVRRSGQWQRFAELVGSDPASAPRYGPLS